MAAYPVIYGTAFRDIIVGKGCPQGKALQQSLVPDLIGGRLNSAPGQLRLRQTDGSMIDRSASTFAAPPEL
jgi:hypothetical protein